MWLGSRLSFEAAHQDRDPCASRTAGSEDRSATLRRAILERHGSRGISRAKAGRRSPTDRVQSRHRHRPSGVPRDRVRRGGQRAAQRRRQGTRTHRGERAAHPTRPQPHPLSHSRSLAFAPAGQAQRAHEPSSHRGRGRRRHRLGRKARCRRDPGDRRRQRRHRPVAGGKGRPITRGPQDAREFRGACRSWGPVRNGPCGGPRRRRHPAPRGRRSRACRRPHDPYRSQ